MRFSSVHVRLLALLLAVLLPLQGIAGMDGDCCPGEARAATLAHGHVADALPLASTHAVTAGTPDAGCPASIMPCCHATALPDPPVAAAPALTGAAPTREAELPVPPAPVPGGPDRPPRAHSA